MPDARTLAIIPVIYTVSEDALRAVPGNLREASLALGAKSAMAFWPGLTSLIVLLAEYGGRRPASEEALLSVD